MNLKACIAAATREGRSALPKAAAVTAVATLVALGGAAQAEVVPGQIIYSGPVNIVVPNNIDGVYLNVVTGATGTSNLAVPGWDLNPYSASTLTESFNLWGPTVNTWLSTSGALAGPYPLAGGTMIDGSGSFLRPGGGTNVGLQVTLDAPNLFGFRFINESMGNEVQYGWIEITFGSSIIERSITGWAYENSGAGIMAGVIPEPGTYALMLAGLAAVGGIAARRRQRQAEHD